MSRYWRIYQTFLRSSLSRELEFRANFIAKIFHNLAWTLFFLIVLIVIYSKTDNLAGWTKADSFMLAGTLFVLESFLRGFFFSLTEIPESVRKGTLDFVITKPVDTQFWISTRRFNFDQLGVLIGGTGLIIAGTIMSGHSISFIQVFAYFILLFSAIALFYAFNLALMTLGIWLVRVDNLWVLSDTLLHVARYPIDIYGSLVQRFLLFVLPLGLLATVPVRQLKDGFDPLMVGVGLAWAIGLFVAARMFWNFALRSYGSASS